MGIKKGQKFRKDYSDELIGTVIGEYINNQGTYQSIANKYNIASWHTVEMWVRKYRKNNQIIRQKRGRIKNDEINYKERYEILKKYQALPRNNTRKNKFYKYI